MTIYEELLSRVEQGEKFSIDFEKRDMKVGKDWLIKDGVWDKKKELINDYLIFLKPLDTIEILYNMYKISCPSQRSDSNRKKYFKALSVDELTDEQMIVGLNREVAQARLEAFILIAILKGWTWKEEYGKWFWASQNDKDLILLRRWIDG